MPNQKEIGSGSERSPYYILINDPDKLLVPDCTWKRLFVTVVHCALTGIQILIIR